MSYKFAHKALVILIPVFAIGFFLLYSPRSGENARRDDSGTDSEQSTDEFVSRLQNQDDFPIETLSEPITELRTEILAESESDDDFEVIEGDSITVHYRGWLRADGTIFDQSFNRGDEGFTFLVGSGVIDGWSEGVLGMKQGEVRRLYIPSEQAYGEAGSGASIPPNSDLIFDVELIQFN